MKKLFDNKNYVVTSGWWCGKVDDEKRVRYGSESIREVSFFSKWKESVLNNTTPRKIMVFDSASPVKPDNSQLNGIEFLSLVNNPGHSTNHNGHYSGYTRSVLMGITYAAMCDADYWVYVEQDVLLNGNGIIEHCIEHMTTPYMFGSGEGTPQFLQQSLIIIRKDGFFPFLEKMNKIKSRDKEISPESKFLIATSPFFRLIPELCYRAITKKNLLGKLTRKFISLSLETFKGYDELPIGYGRTRPINFSRQYYYFQHGTEDELNLHYEQLISNAKY